MHSLKNDSTAPRVSLNLPRFYKKKLPDKYFYFFTKLKVFLWNTNEKKRMKQSVAIKIYVQIPSLIPSILGWTASSHGDIILNKSNNSVFLHLKSIEIGKSPISSVPQEFEWNSKCFVTKLLPQNFKFGISKDV